MTEKQMRESKVPDIRTKEELNTYIGGLVGQDHDYGTCVYAMSMAATAAFNYVASKLGVTGFQASCADLDILRRTRSLESPFMIVDADKWLYPQYNPEGDVKKFKIDNKEWLTEQANEKLNDVVAAHPNVIEHWKKLAKGILP